MMAKHKYRRQPWFWLPLVMTCLACATATAQTNLPGWVDPTFEAVPAPIGQINAVIRTADGKFLVAGNTDPADPVLRGGIARLHADGALDTSFNAGLGANLSIWSIVLQTNGQILVAGDFTTFNGLLHPHIARLNADGSLDSSFNPAADAMVWSIALQPDGRILVGGDFAYVNDVLRARVARLEANGTLDATFNPSAGPNGTVRTLLLQNDGRVIIAGGFGMVGDAPRGHIARLESTGALDATFATGAGANDWVSTVTPLRSGQLLVSGFFTSFDGNARNRLARLNPNGTLDPSFDVGTGPDGGVVALVEQIDGKVVIAGGFNALGGRVQGRISRLLENGELDRTFEADPGADSWVESLTLLEDGRIIMAGAFNTVHGTARNRIARVFGGDPSPYAPVITDFPVTRTVREGVDVVFSARARAFPEPGYQWRFNGVNLPGAIAETLMLRNVRTTNAGTYSLVVSNSLGAVTNSVTLTVTPAPTHSGALDVTFHTGLGPTNLGTSLALQDTRVLMGGGFHDSQGIMTAVARRFNLDGSLDVTFQPTPLGFGTVEALVPATSGSVIVAGTAFASVRRLLNSGLIDSTYPATTNPLDTIYALATLGGGQVLGGGRRLPAATVVLRRFLANGAADPAFADLPGGPGAILALSPYPGGGSIAGGTFTSINGLVRNRIARFHANGTIDASFNIGSGPNSDVLASAVLSDGRIIIGGAFTRVNGVPRNRVARLLPTGALDMSFDPGPGPNNNVFAVAAQPDGRVLIGGTFNAIDDVPRQAVARLNADGSLDPDFDTSVGPEGPVRDILPVGAHVIIAGGFQTVGGIPRPAIARLNNGIAPLTAPVIVLGPSAQTVPAGADVTMFVVARAQPAATYAWQLNGTNVPGATSWVLRLRNVSRRDAGLYRVIVSNSQGSVVSGEAELRVLPAMLTPGAPDLDFFAGAGPNDEVNAIVVDPDGKAVIGGAFTEVDGFPRVGIARLHPSGDLDQSFDPGTGANGPVRSLARQADGKLIVGGDFTVIDGMQRNRIARLDADGFVDLTFDPGLGADDNVLAIETHPEGQITIGTIGGAFTNVGGLLRPGIARLNSDGSLDTNFVSRFGPGSTVAAIDFQSDGQAIVGGFFRPAAILPVPFWKTARLESDGVLDLTFSNSPAVGGPVLSLAVLEDDRVLAGGAFIARLPGERNRIMRLNTNGSPDLTFATSFGASNVVNAVALQADGKALLGGAFEGIDGFPFKRIARLNADGRVDALFNPGRGVESGTMFIDEYGELVDLTSINAVVVEPNGHVLIGGDFTEVNGVTRPYIARLYGRAPSTAISLRRLAGSSVELTWELGTLEHAIHPAGPWREVANATSPMLITTGTVQRFYRLRID